MAARLSIEAHGHLLRWGRGSVQQHRRVSDLSAVRCRASPRPFSDIPGPRSLPLLGSLWTYKTGRYDVNRYHEALRSMYEQYGPVVRERFGTSTVVHLFEPDLVRQVHQQEGKYPAVPPLQELVLLYRQKNNMSLGLGNTNGEAWYRLRSAVQQLMMRPREVSCFLPLVDTVSRALVDRVDRDLDDTGQVPELTPLIFKWGLESATHVCAERRFGALSGGADERRAEQLIAANRQVAKVGGRLKFSLPLYRYVSTPGWRQLAAAERHFSSVTIELFDNVISEIEKLAEEGKLQDGQYKFLCFLMTRPKVSRKDVLIIAYSMFNDGLSTTVPALLCALWCLAHTPAAQQSLHSEITAALPGGEAQEVTADVISRLPFVKAVLKETLRLYPIGTEVSRITDQDMELGGYVIPAGTHVDLNQSVQLRSARWFADPEDFRPERWLGEQRKAIHSYLHIPFGHGTRMCAGKSVSSGRRCRPALKTRRNATSHGAGGCTYFVRSR
ncbi:probable cytochrome P450 CYP44 [Pollicipes pollicipes]|uniref:probable cytochrome P450 CYP44 n=1 Tax=Pollicipes pollicipes TaxID=41117 RepID=UPI0018851E17|nr:probable cytochrome P450 CYP44 [Pollicipes pollicipes]